MRELHVTPMELSEMRDKHDQMNDVDFSAWAAKRFNLDLYTEYKIVVNYPINPYLDEIPEAGS